MWRYKKLSALFLLFSAIYLVQSTLVTPDQAQLDKYHVSATQAMLLGLTIAIPYIIIWCIALIGYLRLKSYVASIDGSKDGRAFTMLSYGLGWLALWLPVTAIADGFSSHYYAAHPSATAALVIFSNYLNLALLFPAFVLTYYGTRKLLTVIRQPHPPFPQKTTLLFIGFAAFYTFLVLQDPSRQVAVSSDSVAAYYMPDWLIVVSFVIPRLIMWFLGLQAVYNMYRYRLKVQGSLYKTAFDNLARGVAAVVLITIILRCIQSLSSSLNQWHLLFLLVIVYILLLMVGIGYGLIAKGARHLQRLEEL